MVIFMAWRLNEMVTQGVINNRQKGKVAVRQEVFDTMNRFQKME